MQTYAIRYIYIHIYHVIYYVHMKSSFPKRVKRHSRKELAMPSSTITFGKELFICVYINRYL